jgi:hypothetical protein
LVVTSAAWDRILAQAERIAEATLAEARLRLTQGEAEAALQWTQALAGFIAHGGTFGRLVNPGLEALVLSVAERLPHAPGASGRTAPAGHAARDAPRVLHVLTEAFASFGHTGLCRRWIAEDTAAARHDVLLLDQFGAVPQALAQAVQARGGQIERLDTHRPLLERAAALRARALAGADQVVLHAHPNDPLPAVAFGVPGGPPVLLVNHADHEFWLGAAVADRVIDQRPSAAAWTRCFRAIERCQTLPLLLDAPTPPTDGTRAATRRQFQIADDEVLLLSVGSARKYQPVQGLSFFDATQALLERCPQARVLVAGPAAVGPWAEAERRSGGRLRAIGHQADLAPLHAAADVYLEGLPAGSLTALLEAALTGLPCVRTALPSRPPHASDSEALEPWPQPADQAAYVEQAAALILQPALRREQGAAVQQRVRSVHGAVAWRDRLVTLRTSLPAEHAVYRGHAEALPPALERSEIEIKLDYAFPDPAAAPATLLLAWLWPVTQSCAAARVRLEAALARRESWLGGGAVDAKALAIAALPPLAGALGPGSCAAPAGQFAPVARWLLRRMAAEGRRGAALRLALRLSGRVPGLWRADDLRKGAAALFSR